MTKKEKYYGLLMVLIVISQSLPALIYKVNGYPLPSHFLSEDGIYESVAALSCFLAGIVFFYSFVTYPKTINYFIFSSTRNLTALSFSLLMFFLFAEEISWGQRLFNIQTPTLLSEINFQKEINLHNLTLIQSTNNFLSDLLFKALIIYLFVLPLFAHSFSFVKSLVERLAVPVASLQIVLFVFIIRNINVVNYRIYYSNTSEPDRFHIGEAFESNIEILLLLLSVEYLLLCRKTAIGSKPD